VEYNCYLKLNIISKQYSQIIYHIYYTHSDNMVYVQGRVRMHAQKLLEPLYHFISLSPPPSLSFFSFPPLQAGVRDTPTGLF